MKCAYRKYYIVCIITVSHSKFCADIAQNSLNELSRLTTRKVNGLATNYTYKNIGGNQTTTLVESINTDGIAYSYDYDEVNNIKSVTAGNKKITYEYDELNQLTRVNDPFENVTHVYTYKNGNIVYDLVYEYSMGTLPSYPQSATQYLYENATWSDVLTDVKKSHYEGSTEVVDEQYAISSDEIGNTTDYKGSTYTWVGRQLRSITNSDNSNTTYSYNSDGQRISKIVNTADGKMYNYRYYYNGDILAGFILYATESGSMTYVGQIRFMYDENGEAFGIDINGKEYFYVKNAQNDVVRIVNSSNETVVSYQYDSWGKLLSCEDTSENGIVSFINPYTYRGYYYDSDTEMYFLKSRYYNPELHRFINADGICDTDTGILSHNMFVYCNNNPINSKDTNGTITIGVLLCAVAAVAVVATVCAIKKKLPWIFQGGAGNKAVSNGYTAIDNCVEIGKNSRRDFEEIAKSTYEYRTGKNKNPKVSNTNRIQRNKKLVANFVENRDFAADLMFYSCNVSFEKGNSWESLPKEKREEIINNIIIWDEQSYSEIIRSSASDMLREGVKIYDPR